MSPASHTLPNLTGSLIDDGSLELLALLGSGAYGKVYKARDLAVGPDETTFYAVKCMRRYAPGSRAHSIQQDELLIHQMVSDHPRIITFYRNFTTEEYVFVVLEFAQSDFFSAVVDREIFRHRPALIKEAFNEVLDAVDFLHRNGIYHRDIKPENILCDKDGTNLRFADFGLSTQRQLSTQFGCGSRFYMSPEFIDPMTAEGCYSARYSDMWAISVLFTNLISGHMPWTSADMSDPAYAFFCKNDDYLMRALNLTPETNALLTRCFAENPRRRPTIEQFRVAVNGMERFALDDEVEVEILAPVPVTQAQEEYGHGQEQATPRPHQPIVMPQPIDALPHSQLTNLVECTFSEASSYPFIIGIDPTAVDTDTDESSSAPTSDADDSLLLTTFEGESETSLRTSAASSSIRDKSSAASFLRAPSPVYGHAGSSKRAAVIAARPLPAIPSSVPRKPVAHPWYTLPTATLPVQPQQPHYQYRHHQEHLPHPHLSPTLTGANLRPMGHHEQYPHPISTGAKPMPKPIGSDKRPVIAARRTYFQSLASRFGMRNGGHVKQSQRQ
ncbi:kinase-like domain-containing protein [Mycena amicta]|nr:kinase-like domain-containing protein [Mycena amicta]